MRAFLRVLPLYLFALITGPGLCYIPLSEARPAAAAVPRGTAAWRVEDLRRGMKGIGLSVFQGTEIQTFQAEILGILRNTSPGRDLVLARLSGQNLEKTGVLAGMSGSPVYIDNKLVGAVAYAWAFGKEPIAGITPFVQMQSFVEALDRQARKVDTKPVRVGLGKPLRLAGKDYSAVTVSQDSAAPRDGDGLWLVPLRAPLAATGFTPHSLRLLAGKAGKFGLVPVTGGAAGKAITEKEQHTPLEPGSPLAVSLITGDFDLSGIGTTTHVEGKRVWGWGHPFMSLGGCDIPMSIGFIHTIYPRQTVSFKMGSPLREIGVMNADVSTCIAGTLDRKAKMLPVRMSVTLNQGESRTFNVRVAQHRNLLPTLVYTALTNSVDMEGELPEEMTARMTAKIDIEGHGTVVLRDTFSGFSGGRAPAVLYSQVAGTLSHLIHNSFRTLEIKSIECDTRIEPGRISAEIDTVALDSEEYRPGDTVQANVTLRPFKGDRQHVRVAVKLPGDLPEGTYTALICDEPSSTKADLRGNPTLYYPTTDAQVVAGVKLLLSAKRTTLAVRVATGVHGVASAGKSLPRLPDSMVRILSNTRRTGAMTIKDALVARKETDWVIQGAESITFLVTKTPRVTRHDP